MTDEPRRYAHLTFNAPLSEARATALVSRLAAARPASVLDLGCGRGELLLRIAKASPEATARGVDTDDTLLDRGRAAARTRGLEVVFDALDAARVTEPADLVICIGSGHALGETPAAYLPRLRDLVRPGGRLVLGEGTWEERGPVDRSLVWDDLLALPPLGGLVDLAMTAGFRPLWIETASQDELDAFESGYLADQEEWLMTHRDPARRDRCDDHRRRWLHGYRNGFGFAYLTLGVPQPGEGSAIP